MNYWIKAFLLSLVFTTSTLSAMEYKQPVYSLEFNIYGTGAEIRLNDIPVYYHDGEGQVSSQKPIPESIIDGENILTVKSFPLEDDVAEYLQGAYIQNNGRTMGSDSID